MNVLSLRNVVKAYHSHIAVNDVSFDVKAGTIFGLLGPNGAGKTSLIRIITTITGADSGEVLLNGEPLNHLHPNEIGYMPEERGLYKKMKVGEQLLYLAQLKGLTEKEAKETERAKKERAEETAEAQKKAEKRETKRKEKEKRDMEARKKKSEKEQEKDNAKHKSPKPIGT